ncbi:MAG: PAS domain S-box protein [Candidatus Thiodiazotropha sp. (ex Lucinoma borealis)]|nr:PAS domain S-box protein [Candidatus Thiodiazotropha sp. (ex Lucinoma borealis)]MCU7867141.1 PAS domain S-box protein [Candidatus Thiodiazotropha sp. (ex Lucinoma borealis)]
MPKQGSSEKSAGQTTKKKASDGNMTISSKTPARPDKQGFPIVALGASAGGLEAFETFFKAMPHNSGMAFVLVAHLDPTHVSLLPELVQKRSRMQVHQVLDGMKVQSNHVYVIPPNKNLRILNGTLQLFDLTKPRGANLPIDSFFRSLASDQGTNAVCIILSGTGTDGTLGLKAIKGEIGMVMVQDEVSAKYDGMPRSAISTGLADYVLPPDKMPEQLIKYTRHAFQKGAHIISPLEGKTPNTLQKIYIILRAQTDHDFSLYKKNTICRRIERRMNIHQIDDIKDYVRYLQESEREVGILFKELLIGVTNFFRDPTAFDLLRDKYLPKMLADKPDDYTIRVWVAGCSSGEEAYSLAIVLHECMVQMGRHFNIQIFGTDIDEEAIDLARSGLYPESILADVSAERIQRFFSKEDGGRYRIKKLIREMLVFAPQNVIKDPPFTKLDILSCRNLLIYLGSELQKKLLPVFHYSLKQEGILFLGSSESIGQTTELFSPLDKKWKLFHRQASGNTLRPLLDFPATSMALEQDEPTDVPASIRKAEEISALQLVETILQQSNTPPCVIIDDNSNVIYIHGRIGQFLEPAEGRISVNILEMARPDLKSGLASAIRKVAMHKQEVTVRDLNIGHGNGRLLLDLLVKPILEQSVMHGLMMVVFEEKSKSSKIDMVKPQSGIKKVKKKSVEELENELQYTKENLQTTIEELETSNEELKSTNEELQSTNEELQSTNEEMETSKEELQSLNEESATVNAELQSRIDELSQTNDDMKNLLDSTEIATLFLDVDLCIRRFTPKVTEIVPLTVTDSGRPISHFMTSLVNVDLAEYGREVLKDLAVREDQVKSQNGNVFAMKVRPYRTTNNLIDGVVITFDDITARKQADEALEQHRVFQEAVLDCTANGIVACNEEGTLTYFNKAAHEFYGLPLERIPQHEWTEHYDLFEVDGKTPLKLEHIPLARALRGEQVSNQECVIAPKGRSAITVSVTGQMLTDSAGHRLGAVVSMNDISLRKQADKVLCESEQRYRMLFELAAGSVLLIDAETGHVAECNSFAYEHLGYSKQEFLTMSVMDVEAVESKEEVSKHIKAIVSSGEDVFETRHKHKDGTVIDVLVRAKTIVLDDKPYILTLWHDIQHIDMGEIKNI